jgi:hypothetical protein
MREFFKHPFVVLVLLITGTILAGIIFFKTCTHEVTYKGTVMSHHTASNRYGEIEYYTIVVFEDGTIRSISGLKFYVKKVGGTVHYTQTKLK